MVIKCEGLRKNLRSQGLLPKLDPCMLAAPFERPLNATIAQ